MLTEYDTFTVAPFVTACAPPVKAPAEKRVPEVDRSQSISTSHAHLHGISVQHEMPQPLRIQRKRP